MSAAVRDVPACFRAIPPKVRERAWRGGTAKYLGAHHKATSDFVGAWDFTTELRNSFGFFEHFQGMQRIGRRLVVSGGVNRGPKPGAVLVVIDMGSRAALGPWALPSYAQGDRSHKSPHVDDRSVHVVSVDPRRWHAGGIQAAEGIVAVPAYEPGDHSSTISFVDLNESSPQKPAATLWVTDSEAKAVGFVRLNDGRPVLVVWDDERLDFYLGKPPAASERPFEWIEQRRFEKRQIEKHNLPSEFFPGGFPRTGTYQSVNLVRDLKDEALYLVCTRNVLKFAPYFPAADFADLYRVEWPGFSGHPRVVHVASAGAYSKQMYCYNEQCNFAGPAGIYTEAPHRLWIYAGWHWLHDGNRRFTFNEYSYL